MAAVQLVSWFLCLSVWVAPSESYRLDGVKVYEVVRPVRLHDLHKRNVESPRPDTLKYALTLGGKDIELYLERSSDFITEAYTETHYKDDGTPVVKKPTELDLCYYQGKIVNDSKSMVSLSTCDGLRGYFQTAEQQFVIEPLPESGDGHHALLKYEDVTATPSSCGVANTTWQPAPEGIPPPKPKSRSSGLTMFQQKKYIELYMVADNRMYLKMDSDIQKVRTKIYEIVNFVNSVYKPLNIFVALTGLEVWTDSDKINVTEPAGDTLGNFTKWRNDDLITRQKHDNAQLITGIDLQGSTVGLSYVGSFCTKTSTGINQDTNKRAIAVGATMAHEIGHNLGMRHDDSLCVCNDSICIMTDYLKGCTKPTCKNTGERDRIWVHEQIRNYTLETKTCSPNDQCLETIPKLFSNCSIRSLEQYLNARNPDCLLNEPHPKALLQPAACGNGFKEVGEECDCGPVEECTNPCCNATTCTLAHHSQCADGECCRNCKIAHASHICRHKADECDLPEYCTGNSRLCPEDVFAVNGLPCSSGKGYCYNGQCPQRKDQCVKMWGPSAVVANDTCYNRNTKGTYYAYCVRPSNDKYIGCLKQDVMCGKLFCAKGQNLPNYGNAVSITGCKATFYKDCTSDFGQVDNGTKCDEGKVCKDYKCVNLETAYKATNCSAKCNGHGVCNNKLECSCEPGWLLPFCEKPAPRSYGIGSDPTKSNPTSSNEQAIIIAAVCVLVAAVFFGVGIYLVKFKKNSPPPTKP